MTGKNLAEFLEICLFFGFNLLFTEKNQTEFLKNFQNFLKTCVLFPLKIKDRKLRPKPTYIKYFLQNGKT